MPEFLGRLRTPRLPAAPSSPLNGEMYFDTATNVLYWWNGTAWVSASGGGLTYEGNHVPATSYQEGDIVIDAGISYLCVEPTTAAPVPWPHGIQIPPLEEGKWLTVESGAAVWEDIPPSGAELAYEGDYVATPYTDGDIVVYDNKAWLCVTPTSTPPDPWPGGANPSNLVYKAGYGTTLPASPADGQEHVLVDSVTNPSYQWRFRFNAQSSSAYKWEFVGGPSAYVPNLAEESLAGLNAWTNAATPGPDFLVARAGDYLCDAHAVFIATTQNSLFQISAGIAGVGPGAAVGLFVTSNVNVYTSISVENKFAALAAGQTIRVLYYSSGGTAKVAQRTLSVTPVRVS